jgi:hypothetical protein
MKKNILIWTVLSQLIAFSSFSKTLVITDSHGEGAFGMELAMGLENNGQAVSVYAVGGSTAADWNHGLQQVWGYWEYHSGHPEVRSTKPITPVVSRLLETETPDSIIIELGTNLIWKPISEQDREEIRLLLSTIKKTQINCIWVGPPALRPKPMDRVQRELEIRELLYSIVPSFNCELVLSWAFTQYPALGGDGIHYDGIPGIGPDLARQWARGVIDHLTKWRAR